MGIEREKIKVGILFGGKSAEHEVSLQSAKNVCEALDRSKFDPVLIGIDKKGKWHLYPNDHFLLNDTNPSAISLNPSGDPVALIPGSEGLLLPHHPLSLLKQTCPSENSGNDRGSQRADSIQETQLDVVLPSVAPLPNAALSHPHSPLPNVDVIFPILHGPFGEDGTVQGLLKLAEVPFVGPGVLGSAVGMDKDVMKRLFRDAGIPIGKFLVFKSHEPFPSFSEITSALGTPVFVKPANMGSSVGVSKARDGAGFTAAVKDAFQYDTKIVIEEFIKGREIECAVLGDENPIASVPGEIIPTHEFYSYEAKYLDTNGAKLVIPAKLDGVTRQRIQELSIRAFQTLCCEGLSRIDFLLRENNEPIINEINPMPGFTKISMYPKLWEASGIGYTELITRLIEMAMKRFEKEKTLKISYA
jgi:D-alanine-D-alanine ligase